MGKVIDFYTRKEVTDMPVTIAEGEAMIEHLLQYELELEHNNQLGGPYQLIENLISMVECNSGASRYVVMDRIYMARKI